MVTFDQLQAQEIKNSALFDLFIGLDDLKNKINKLDNLDKADLVDSLNKLYKDLTILEWRVTYFITTLLNRDPMSVKMHTKLM